MGPAHLQPYFLAAQFVLKVYILLLLPSASARNEGERRAGRKVPAHDRALASTDAHHERRGPRRRTDTCGHLTAANRRR